MIAGGQPVVSFTERSEDEGLWLRHGMGHSWQEVEVAASGFSPLVKAPDFFFFLFPWPKW